MVTIAATLTTTLPEAGRGVAELSFTVTDTDEYVTLVGATVEWGDGSSATYVRQAVPLVVSQLQNVYGPGKYVVNVTARNYKPQPETAIFTDVVDVKYPVTSLVELGQTPVIFGPILPREQGYPNAQQWSFNIGNDSRMIESSLRMLLLTNKGDRLMTPGYGTNLRALLFSPNTADVSSSVNQEIAKAVAEFEPRATFQSATITQSGRNMTVNAIFSSVVDQNAIALTLDFAT